MFYDTYFIYIYVFYKNIYKTVEMIKLLEKEKNL